MSKAQRPVTLTQQLNRATDIHNILIFTVSTTFDIPGKEEFLELEELRELVEAGDLTKVKQTSARDWTIEIYKSKAAALKKEEEQDHSLYSYTNFK
jgi:hypothetical protein